MNSEQYYHKLFHIQNEIKDLCEYSNDGNLDDALSGIAYAVGNAKAKLIDEEAKKYRKLKGIKFKD